MAADRQFNVTATADPTGDALADEVVDEGNALWQRIVTYLTTNAGTSTPTSYIANATPPLLVIGTNTVLVFSPTVDSGAAPVFLTVDGLAPVQLLNIDGGSPAAGYFKAGRRHLLIATVGGGSMRPFATITASGSITTTELADGSVTQVKLAKPSVGTAELLTGNVTNVKLAEMNQSLIKGRPAGAGLGAPTDLSATEVRTIINVEAGADVTDKENVAAAIASAPAKGSLVDADTTGFRDAAASGALVEVAWSAIKATLLTYFNTQFRPNSMNSQRLLGRDTAGVGVTEELQVGAPLEFSGSASLRLASAGVLNGHLGVMAEATIKGRQAGVGSGGPQDLSAVSVRTIIGVESGADVTDKENVSAAIQNAPVKTTPVDGDSAAFVDSAAAGALVRVSWASIKATLQTYFNTQYRTNSMATDRLLGRDTAGTGAAEELTVGGGIVFTDAGGIEIGVNAVSNSRLAIMADSAIKGRIATSGAGTPHDLTPAQARTILSVELNADVTDKENVSAAIQAAPIKGTPADGDSAAFVDSAAAGALVRISWAAAKAALKTYFDTQYRPNVMQTDRLLGRDTPGTGIAEEIQLGFPLELSGSASLRLAQSGVANGYLAAMAEGTIKGRSAGVGTGGPQDLSPASVRTILSVSTTAEMNTALALKADEAEIRAASDPFPSLVQRLDNITGSMALGSQVITVGGGLLHSSGSFETGPTITLNKANFTDVDSRVGTDNVVTAEVLGVYTDEFRLAIDEFGGAAIEVGGGLLHASGSLGTGQTITLLKANSVDIQNGLGVDKVVTADTLEPFLDALALADNEMQSAAVTVGGGLLHSSGSLGTGQSITLLKANSVQIAAGTGVDNVVTADTIKPFHDGFDARLDVLENKPISVSGGLLASSGILSGTPTIILPKASAADVAAGAFNKTVTADTLKPLLTDLDIRLDVLESGDHELETARGEEPTLAKHLLELSSGLVERPGDRPDLFTSNLIGDAISLIPLDSGTAAYDSDGKVLRQTAPVNVARLATFRIEPSRLYRTRCVLRRRTNPVDPSNDTVSLRVQWLNAAQAGGVGTTIIADDNDLTTADGRVELTGVVARAAGTGIDFVAPVGSIYGRVYVQLFGVAVTDIEVLEVRDITDTTMFTAPDVTALEGRVTAIESEDLPDRVEALEAAAIPSADSMTFMTRAAAETAAGAGSIPSSVDLLETKGTDSEVDGRPVTYVRGLSVPAEGDYFDDLDGTFWISVLRPYAVECGNTNIFDDDRLGIGRPPDFNAPGFPNEDHPTRDWNAWPFLRQVMLPTDPITTTNLSKTFRINYPNHGLTNYVGPWRSWTLYNYVELCDDSNTTDQSVTVNGLKVVNQYEVTVIDASTLEMTTNLAAANASGIGGGSTIRATIWTQQGDLYHEKGHNDWSPSSNPVPDNFWTQAWGRDHAGLGTPLSIARKPAIPIVPGWTYKAHASLDNVTGGNARLKFDGVPGDGAAVSAAAGSAGGSYNTTITAVAGSTYARYEMSSDFVGEIKGPVFVTPLKSHLLVERKAYVIGEYDATDEWAGKENHIAIARAGVWVIIPPFEGQRLYFKREKVTKTWDGTQWIEDHPGIIADFDAVMDRWWRPPYASKSANEGTQWDYRGWNGKWPGLGVRGFFAVLPHGGFFESEIFPSFMVRDTHPGNLSQGYGWSAAGGLRRTIIEQGIDLQAWNDTPEIRIACFLSDERGKAIDWYAGSTGMLGRIYWEPGGLHPISGKFIYLGRVIDLIGECLPGMGGELRLRMVPAGQPHSAIRDAIKWATPSNWTQNHLGTFYWFPDLNAGAGGWKQLDMATLESVLVLGGVVMDNPTHPALQRKYLYMDA